MYKSQLNVEGCGAVCAAPGPGAQDSYYFHWMRDAGLSIKAWLEINDNNLTAIEPEVDAYVDWVEIVQQKPDPNGDVRVEPKFEIPSGDPFSGGWCRPQTDGPALRGLCFYKKILGQISIKIIHFFSYGFVKIWNVEACGRL